MERMTDIWTGFVLVSAAATAVAAAIVAATAKWRIESVKCRIKEFVTIDSKRANPPLSIIHSPFSIHTAVFVFFAAIAVHHAGAKHGGTNAPPRGGSVELKMENVELRNRSQFTKKEQIHNSPFYILHSQFNSQFPSNAVLHDKWWRRGAWEDVMRVAFPQGWVFPFGEDHLAFVDVVSQGSLRRRWTDTNEIASVGIPLALVPFSSLSWHEFTPSNTCRFVWNGAFAGRSADAPADAAIELFRNGAVSVETNGVSRRIERPWRYGETNAVMSSVEADSMIGDNGLFVFAVAFTSAPPETVCLCVGTNRVAVSDACECCFVLEKGTRHSISPSCVPDGVVCQWWDSPVPPDSPPLRSEGWDDDDWVDEKMRAYGSAGEVEFDDPADGGTGSILWDCSLYIAPDSALNPTYPMLLYAFMDVPCGENPEITWEGDDGAISETGAWLTLEERPASCVIGVTARWRGRTWYGDVFFWSDVPESIVALDGGGVVFVESAYTNSPGDVTLRTSTEQTLKAHWALDEDGTVTLSATEGGAVSVRADSPDGAPVELPYSWYGCSGDVGSMTFYVTNNDPAQCGQVGFTLEFDGEDGEYCIDSSGPLEIVRFRVEADADWPSNKVRHVFGPLETFNAVIEGGPEFSFTAPLTPGDSSVSFDYHGSSCSVPIRVIAPNGVAGFWRADDFECSGSTIGAGFFADVQVLPTYVSFKDLWVMEDVAPVANRWGCFLNLLKYPHEQFAHTEERGALRPQEIGDRNMINGHDHARTKLGGLPTESGGFSLDIPLKWGINGGPCIYNAGRVLQTTSVHTNGNVTISKFGITRGRKPYESYEDN